jgi:hypothetical protein
MPGGPCNIREGVNPGVPEEGESSLTAKPWNRSEALQY